MTSVETSVETPVVNARLLDVSGVSGAPGAPGAPGVPGVPAASAAPATSAASAASARGHVPEWEKPCWIVAISKTLGTTEDRIQQLARKHGWDGESFGAQVQTTVAIAWDLIGKMPDLSLTRAARGMTARQFSGSNAAGGLTGLVFTNGHVMPMVDGHLSNFNGWGDEPVIAVATYSRQVLAAASPHADPIPRWSPEPKSPPQPAPKPAPAPRKPRPR